MKGYAVVFTDRMKVTYMEVEIPDPSEDEVVIDVELSWISNGTEGSFLRGERVGGDTPYDEGKRWPFPIVAGYQKVGRIRQVGSNVSHLKVGDRVFATVSRVSHMYDPHGGHVSPAVTSAGQVWKLPDDCQPDDFAGLVLTQVGYNCGMRAPVQTGTTAVVIGDGLVGQWTAQTLLHRGAQVVVLGRHSHRLELLSEQAQGINTRERAAIEEVNSRLPDGIDIIVDTVGDLATFYELFPLMKGSSHMVSAGFYGHEGKIDIQKLRYREMTLHAPAGWTTERMNQTLEGVVTGWLQTRKLITHRFPVQRAAEAWQVIQDRAIPSLGVVLDW